MRTKSENALAWGILIAVGILVIVTFVQLMVVKSNIETACRESNETRVALNDYFTREKERTKTIDYELFPDIPKDQFKTLIQENLDVISTVKRQTKPRDCANP